MSLINDALKRASQSDKKRERPPDGPGGMTPAPERRGVAIPVAIGAAIALLAVGSAWFFWRAMSAQSAPAPKPSVTIIGGAPVSSPAPARIIHEPPKPEPAQVVAAPGIAPPVVAPQPKQQRPEAVAVAPPEKTPEGPFPELKLQAIFYSKTNPHALINGRTVGQGEEIGEARVKKIQLGGP